MCFFCLCVFCVVGLYFCFWGVLLGVVLVLLVVLANFSCSWYLVVFWCVIFLGLFLFWFWVVARPIGRARLREFGGL